MRQLSSLLFGAWLAAVITVPVVNAGIEEAADAFDKGDYATTIRELKPLAILGNATAQAYLGAMYDEGLGITQDYQQAVKWYRMAADQGIPVVRYRVGRPAMIDVMFRLGTMYDEGLGTEQDYWQAVKWLRLAAEYRHFEAQNYLGVMYVKGRGVIQDHKMAYMYFHLCYLNRDNIAPKREDVALRNRDLIAKKMTSEQIEEAERMASKWMAEH